MRTVRLATRLGVSVDVTENLSTHGHNDGRNGRQIRLITIHTAEIGEVRDAAERLGGWLYGPNAPKAGWGYAVDVDSIYRSVSDEDTAWHAGPVNHYSIGIEHAGFARQTPEEWADPYSVTMLERSAVLVAHLCEVHEIPVQRPTLATLKAMHASGGAWGIAGHWDISRAIGGTHTDPGKAFPWGSYLARIRELASGAPEPGTK